MNTKHNPSTIAPPYKNIYSQAVEIKGGSRQLWLSGQLGVKPDGSIDSTIEGQSEIVMSNMKEILASAGMTFDDLIRINAYMLNVGDIPKFAVVRASYIGDSKPAMTTVVVSGLAAPEWLIEVEAVASKND